MFAPAVAEQLRARAVDALAVQELPELWSARDADLFAIAQLDGRCLVSENTPDLLRVEAAWRTSRNPMHCGLVLTSNWSFPRHRPSTTGRLVVALEALVRTDRDLAGLTTWLRPATAQ